MALIVRLWRSRSSQKLSRRWPVLLLADHGDVPRADGERVRLSEPGPARKAGATFVLIFFAVGIARSWELLGLRGGGLLDFLVTRAESAKGGQPG